MGGGSSSGRGPSDEELMSLRQKAREVISDAGTPTRRNVFISFAVEDLSDVNMLRGQTKNENIDLNFSDRSLKTPFNSEKAEYIRRGIRERIKQASVTLVYLSNETADSKWVDWEIRESKRLGKGVIAVYKADSPPSKLPPALKEFGIKPVPWKVKQIAQAIETAYRSKGKE